MNNLKNDLLSAAKSHFTAKRDLAKSNLNVYLSNPAGIGEHGDIMEVVVDLVSQITESNDNIKTVEDMILGNRSFLTEQQKLNSLSDLEYNRSYNDDKEKVFNPGSST